MAKDIANNLGAALTQLGIEDKFLSNGELTSFPLVDRGRIANGIIEEKLGSGKWTTVVHLLFGSNAHAHALYEGDYEQLKKDILQSALSSSREYYDMDKVAKDLADSKEFDLLFKIACSIPINYDEFNKLTYHFPKGFFDGQNLQMLHNVAGKKALEENKPDSAAYHFTESGDKENLKAAFEAMLTHSAQRHTDSLEKIALFFPKEQAEMLKRIILSTCSEKSGTVSALKLYWKYVGTNLTLPEHDVNKLYSNAASEAVRFDVTRLPFLKDARLCLLWAKKHAKSEPQASYRIFNALGYKGKEVQTAVLSGLEIERYQHEDQVLTPQDIQKEHLESAYKLASFKVKVVIAKHQKNNRRLQKLSKQAEQKEDLREAYWLWTAGNGNFESKYLTNIRKRLIEKEIKKGSCWMSFIEKNDRPGKLQAYDALMQERQQQRYRFVEVAYELARSLSDQERMQRAREQMVNLNAQRALEAFVKDKKEPDKTGIEYLVNVMAQRFKVEAPTLARIVEKYASGLSI
ncbi:MAG: hypothetical protein V1837_06185 [Candidatus Woesearchaeota archaeon]